MRGEKRKMKHIQNDPGTVALHRCFDYTGFYVIYVFPYFPTRKKIKKLLDTFTTRDVLRGRKGNSYLGEPNFRGGNEKLLVKKSISGNSESKGEGAFINYCPRCQMA